MVLKRKVPKTEWKKYQEFTKSINLENDIWIQLLRAAKATSSLPAKTESKGTEIKTETNTVQASR